MINKKEYKWMVSGLFALLFCAIAIPAMAANQTILDDNPVAYWAADGDATDSANSYDGAFVDGDVNYTTGANGQAFEFSGDGEEVNIDGTADALNFGTGDFTVEVWFRFNSGAPLNQEFGIINKNIYWQNTPGWGIEAGTFRPLCDRTKFVAAFYLTNGSWSTDIVVNTFALDFDEWYHIVGVREGDTLKVYINGSLTGQYTAPSVTANVNNTTPIRIGQHAWREPFNGAIDEVALFNRALTADEIYSHFQTGGGEFSIEGAMYSMDCSGEIIPSSTTDNDPGTESTDSSSDQVFTQADIEAAIAEGMQRCIDDPASCGIVVGSVCSQDDLEEQYTQGVMDGYDQGHDDGYQEGLIDCEASVDAESDSSLVTGFSIKSFNIHSTTGKFNFNCDLEYDKADKNTLVDIEFKLNGFSAFVDTVELKSAKTITGYFSSQPAEGTIEFFINSTLTGSFDIGYGSGSSDNELHLIK
ncbi:exported hypothetical protein [Desulfamplus magnetovallimortis]|uniref:LamG-like jellyroll fold domain-containing protein n=1 Tax=Desulfamplus magnetovallimortis TaxID=1246637 RepID=A0A1W1HF41_9BACT|nr:LamG domain-containing protein [Desulfamplus magnetovallimortis]SLM30995.1 exported hypothetical protein [Desulfamplus magnetovallimortis]